MFEYHTCLNDFLNAQYNVLFWNLLQEVCFVLCSFVVVLMLGGGDCASQGLNERMRGAQTQQATTFIPFLHVSALGSGESRPSAQVSPDLLVCADSKPALAVLQLQQATWSLCELQKQQGCICIKRGEQEEAPIHFYSLHFLVSKVVLLSDYHSDYLSPTRRRCQPRKRVKGRKMGFWF